MSARSPPHHHPSRPATSHSFSLFPDEHPPRYTTPSVPAALAEDDLPSRKPSLQIVPDEGAYPKYLEGDAAEAFPDDSPTSPFSTRDPASALAIAPIQQPFSMSSSESEEFDDEVTAAVDGKDYREPDGIQNSYDLHAPAPPTPLSNIELLAQRLFSLDHLKLIVRDSTGEFRLSPYLGGQTLQKSALGNCSVVSSAPHDIAWRSASDVLGHRFRRS